MFLSRRLVVQQIFSTPSFPFAYSRLTDTSLFSGCHFPVLILGRSCYIPPVGGPHSACQKTHSRFQTLYGFFDRLWPSSSSPLLPHLFSVLRSLLRMMAMWDELRRDINLELKEFRDPLERDSRKELWDFKASQVFMSQSYVDIKH